MRVLRGAQVVTAAAAALIAAKAIRRRGTREDDSHGTSSSAARAGLGDAVDRRVLSWSRQSAGTPAASPALSPEREREAIETLRDMASRMSDDERVAIERAVDRGQARPRLLGPADGMVWELPGRRLFEIEGVQAFSVTDPEAETQGPKLDR